MQRKLGALAHAPAEDPEPGDYQQPIAHARFAPIGQLGRHLGLGRGGVRGGGVNRLDLLLGGHADHSFGNGQGVMRLGGADLAENARPHLAFGVLDVAKGERAQAAPNCHQTDDQMGKNEKKSKGVPT